MQADPARLASVLEHFLPGARLVAAQPQPGGHIHDSFKLQVSEQGSQRPYLLQTINTHVFGDPLAVMANLAAVSRHLRGALASEGRPDVHRRVLSLVETHDDKPCLCDEDGVFWRLFHFIEGTVSQVTVEDATRARAAAAAYGAFQRRLAGFDGASLVETIPRFHDTRHRLAQLRAAVEADAEGRLAGCGDALEFSLDRTALADVVPPLMASGELPVRVVHNDAKPANVLFDERSGEGLCVIDLDTVMPGSLLQDTGDLIRSMTSSAGEDRTATEVDVDRDLFAAIMEGYLAEAGDSLVPAEREQLVLSGLWITYEQGVRFLTDHLEGDRYFRVARPGHNLARARNQFALVAALERQRDELEALVAGL